MTSTASRRMLATALGLAATRVVPPLADDVHPVARFGSTMQRVEGALYADTRAAGVLYAGTGAALGAISGRSTGSVTAVVAVCAAGPQLRATAGAVADRLEAGDVDGARDVLPALVGRDPSTLDASGIAAAAIESVAENMVDAVFGPAWWAVVAGAPGAAVHRALNTMDAMVGRHGDRYGRFGWAAARADDVANLVPARMFALAVVAAAPDRGAAILGAVRDHAPAHPSPNAGVAEAAVAGALGVSLGGPLRYGDVEEQRPMLGTGPRPDAADLRRAIALTARIEDGLVLTLTALGSASGLRAALRRRR